jgi:hypothetical protein
MRNTIDGWRVLGLLLAPTMVYSGLMPVICPGFLHAARELHSGKGWTEVAAGIALVLAGAWHWRRSRAALAVMVVAAVWQVIMWLLIAGQFSSTLIGFGASLGAAAVILLLVLWPQITKTFRGGDVVKGG